MTFRPLYRVTDGEKQLVHRSWRTTPKVGTVVWSRAAQSLQPDVCHYFWAASSALTLTVRWPLRQRSLDDIIAGVMSADDRRTCDMRGLNSGTVLLLLAGHRFTCAVLRWDTRDATRQRYAAIDVSSTLDRSEGREQGPACRKSP